MTSLPPFNRRVGTQTIAPRYHFTSEGPLIETAKAILELGSDTLKISLNPAAYGIAADTTRSLLSHATEIADFQAVLDMPFVTTFLWAQPDAVMTNGTNPVVDEERLYREMHELTTWLLRRYSGTGRTFILGNWEGDWLLLDHYDGTADPGDGRLEAYRKYYATRQRAVSNARREVAHENVWVGHYVELNRPLDAKDHGRRRLVNAVLPGFEVDLVSYSAYDSLKTARLAEALDYIESNCRFTGYFDRHYERKVFVGEYDAYRDYHVCGYVDDEAQVANTWSVIETALLWGAPFVLFWQLYNNEAERLIHGGGFWLIDPEGTRRPVWHLHRDLLAEIATWRDSYHRVHGRDPDNAAWREFVRVRSETRRAAVATLA